MNVPVVAPAAIVTVVGFGTVADALSLPTVTVNPPLGAALLIVTVAVLAAPPVTVVGDKPMLTSVGGVIESGADTDCDPKDAVILAVVDVPTGEVETPNVPVVWPAAIVIVAGFGTVADALSLATPTVRPLAGAGLLIVTVAVLVAPPATVDGDRAMLTSVGGVIVSGVDFVTPP